MSRSIQIPKRATIAEKLMMRIMKTPNLDQDTQQMIRDLNKDEIQNRDKSMRPMYSKYVNKRRALFKTAQSGTGLYPTSERSNMSLVSKPSNESFTSSVNSTKHRANVAHPQVSPLLLAFPDKIKLRRQSRTFRQMLAPMIPRPTYQSSLFSKGGGSPNSSLSKKNKGQPVSPSQKFSNSSSFSTHREIDSNSAISQTSPASGNTMSFKHREASKSQAQQDDKQNQVQTSMSQITAAMLAKQLQSIQQFDPSIFMALTYEQFIQQSPDFHQLKLNTSDIHKLESEFQIKKLDLLKKESSNQENGQNDSEVMRALSQEEFKDFKISLPDFTNPQISIKRASQAQEVAAEEVKGVLQYNPSLKNNDTQEGERVNLSAIDYYKGYNTSKVSPSKHTNAFFDKSNQNFNQLFPPSNKGSNTILRQANHLPQAQQQNRKQHSSSVVERREQNYSALSDARRNNSAQRVLAERPSYSVLSRHQNSEAKSNQDSQQDGNYRYISPYSLKRIFSNNNQSANSHYQKPKQNYNTMIPPQNEFPQSISPQLTLNMQDSDSRSPQARTMASKFYRASIANSPASNIQSRTHSISEVVKAAMQNSIKKRNSSTQAKRNERLQDERQRNGSISSQFEQSRLFHVPSQTLSPINTGAKTTGAVQSLINLNTFLGGSITQSPQKQQQSRQLFKNGYINFDASEGEPNENISLLENDEGFLPTRNENLVNRDLLENHNSTQFKFEQRSNLQESKLEEVRNRPSNQGGVVDLNVQSRFSLHQQPNMRQVLFDEITRKFSQNLNQEYLRLYMGDTEAGVPNAINSPVNRDRIATQQTQEENESMANFDYKNSSSMPIANDQHIEYYGDPQVLGLVQFNEDMSHIALNIFESFTLFELISSVDLDQRRNLQEIRSQGNIMQQRQENMDRKLDEIEQTLIKLKKAKTETQESFLEYLASEDIK